MTDDLAAFLDAVEVQAATLRERASYGNDLDAGLHAHAADSLDALVAMVRARWHLPAGERLVCCGLCGAPVVAPQGISLHEQWHERTYWVPPTAGETP